MKRRNPRGLRPDEKELWNRIQEQTTPLHKNTRETIRRAVEKTSAPEVARPIPEFRVGQAAPEKARPPLPHSETSGFAAAAVQMDKKGYGKLKRGRVRPEARIDLHGMTVAQAHPALSRFILDAHASGKRLVLVITGKGRARGDGGPMPMQVGILRRQVPHWLGSAPLAPLILQVVQSHQRHGGEGALYVYLRRRQ